MPTHKNRLHIILAVLLIAVMLLSPSVPAGASPVRQNTPDLLLGPQVSADSGHDLSAPLKTLTNKSPATPQVFTVQPLRTLPKSQLDPAQLQQAQGSDMALQDILVESKMPSVMANFDGVTNIADVAPPDTQGDIGYDPVSEKKYYVQWVNLHLQAWDVTNPAAPVALFAEPIAGNTIWSGFGGRCESDNSGDPIVLYDETAHRWMISQFAVSNAPLLQLYCHFPNRRPFGGLLPLCLSIQQYKNERLPQVWSLE